MKLRKRIIWILTIGFVAVMAAIAVSAEEQEQCLFSVEIQNGGVKEYASCWQNKDGDMYVFLPGYADLSEVYIDLMTTASIYVDGRLLEDGLCCNTFQMDTPYEVVYEKWRKKYQNKLTFIQSGNVPTMYIDTESGNMEYIHTKKGNEEAGEVRLYSTDGTLEYEGDVESLNGRGNYTWDAFEKKPYSLKLKEETDLLGMGKAQNWILLANAADLSSLRNKVVYDFAREVGLQYSPESQWVDVYLNGEYAGLYLLSERNEVHSERVDISTGMFDHSFLVSLEKEERLKLQKYSHVVTDADQALRLHYPQNPTTEDIEVIRSVWQSVENAVLLDSGVDPITKKNLFELIDLDSWAKKYLIEEVFGNLDGGLVSQYFYYDDCSGKIFAGPVWDYDHSLGNDFDAAWYIADPNVMVVNRSFVDAIWYKSLYRNDVFYGRMLEIYQRDFLPLIERFLSADLHSYAKIIKKAVTVNDIRWGNSNCAVFDTQIDQLATYMEEHVEFLNQCWLESKQYCEVAIKRGVGMSDRYYAILPNGSAPDLPQMDDTEAFLGWYYVDTDEPFDPSVPITEDIKIYAKWADSGSKKLKQILKLMPLAVIGMLGIYMLAVEIRRRRKDV